jgi:hypothetical protein
MALRMMFGGSPCPSMWGYISDTIADIGNTIIHNYNWNPHDLHDPLSRTLDDPTPLPENIAFHPAKSLAVDIPINDIGKVNIYMDDSIGIALDDKDNTTRVSYTIPLAIHTLAREENSLDPIPRKDIISLKKLLAEGQMEESKTILGWLINTRTLSISLPLDKHLSWSSQISTLASAPQVKHKDLEILIGHLNHCGTILPSIRHFLR